MSDLTQGLPGQFLEIGMNRWTEPFWQAAREHRLVASRCAACSTFRMPPSPYCPECLSQDIDWVTLKGEGTVYSYTIVRRSPYPGYENLLFAPIIVEFPDAPGIRLIGTLVDVEPGAIHIDMPVRVDWSEVKGGEVVPIFRASAAGR